MTSAETLRATRNASSPRGERTRTLSNGFRRTRQVVFRCRRRESSVGPAQGFEDGAIGSRPEMHSSRGDNILSQSPKKRKPPRRIRPHNSPQIPIVPVISIFRNQLVQSGRQQLISKLRPPTSHSPLGHRSPSSARELRLFASSPDWSRSHTVRIERTT